MNKKLNTIFNHALPLENKMSDSDASSDDERPTNLASSGSDSEPEPTRKRPIEDSDDEEENQPVEEEEEEEEEIEEVVETYVKNLLSFLSRDQRKNGKRNVIESENFSMMAQTSRRQTKIVRETDMASKLSRKKPRILRRKFTKTLASIVSKFQY